MNVDIEGIGNYRIVEVLGQGAFGKVFRAVDINNEELQVAVKVCTRSRLEERGALSSLESECIQLDALDHANIVRFKHLIVENEQVGVVLEYLEGQDLRELIKSNGPLELKEVYRLGKSILRGLAYAHKKGLVHRDIKPSNIFICNDGRVKILDFGIAISSASYSQEDRQIYGTPKYIAPEVWLVNQVDPVADVYAFSLVVWEMLVGRSACSKKNYKDVCNWHLTVGPESIQSLRADCPDEVAEFLKTAGAKNPDSRPRTGSEALRLWKQLEYSFAEASAAAFRMKFPNNQEPDATEVLDFDWGVDMDTLELATTGLGERRRPMPRSRKNENLKKYSFNEELWAQRGGKQGSDKLRTITLLFLGVCVVLYSLRKEETVQSQPEEIVSQLTSIQPEAQREIVEEESDPWVVVSGKRFLMGAFLEKKGHEVVLSNDLYVMKTEVTQGEYLQVMKKNPAYFSQCGPDCPVEWISWKEAIAYANAYSIQQGLEPCYVVSSGRGASWPKGLGCEGWRLPTEAEWELAARSMKPLIINGEEVPVEAENMYFAGGNDATDVAWYANNSQQRTHPVCQKEPNHLGLCDLSGNVSEWVFDRFAAYPDTVQQDPLGPLQGSLRIARGGSFEDGEQLLYLTVREALSPAEKSFSVGMRLVRTVQ